MVLTLPDLDTCLSRLAPQDYHRFHSPVSGTLRSFEGSGSELYSVKVWLVLKFCTVNKLQTFSTAKHVVETCCIASCM